MDPHRTERLSDYLDGALPDGERDAIERHVAACDACAETLEALRAVRERAAALAPIAPSRDLWPAIEARLDQPEPRRAVIDLSAERERRARRWSFSLPQLAAAAAALIAITAAVTWTALRLAPAPRGAAPQVSSPAIGPTASIPTPGPDVNGPVGPGPAGSGPAPSGASASAAPRAGSRASTPGADVTLASFDTRYYDLAIADLERALAEHRDKLNPETVKVLEKNLALIDTAIADARKALAADPASMYLNNHLAATMKRKVDLLRQFTAALRT